ncbi:MAG: DNA-binding protein WhiA [bacterium]|nr:DNA-binding protein WhiA [bacterium]
MSFSSELKDAICKLRPSGCCEFAECFGMLFFAREFNEDRIELRTEYEGVARLFSTLIKNCFGVHTRSTVAGKGVGKYKEVIDVSAICKRIFSFSEDYKGDFFKGYTAMRECCAGAFLRGTFLVCGSISNPNKEYHLEFVVKNEYQQSELVYFLLNLNLNPKTSKKGHLYCVYLKQSDQIEELLTRMDVTQYTIELMEIKIEKSVRNRINRINNCESANLTKTVNASVDQVRAIKFLEEEGFLSSLPKELYFAAILRLENPDASLKELCELSDESITRSGMNHRLQKLVKIAQSKEN